MRLISQTPEMTSHEVADKVGISNGSPYYALTALIKKGFVKLGNFRSNPRKGSYAYILTTKGICEKSLLTHSFSLCKGKGFQDLKAEIQVLEEEAGFAYKTTQAPRGENRHV